MNKWKAALQHETPQKSVILFVSGKSYKVVVVDAVEGSISSKLFRNKEIALAHYEGITNA